MEKKKIIIWLLLIVYLMCSAVLLTFQLFASVSKEMKRTTGSKIHGLISLSGIIFCGVGMMIYRLLDGCRTRTVKYIHFGFQTLTTVLLIVGVIPARCGKRLAVSAQVEENNTKVACLYITSQIHLTVGYLLVIAVTLQYAIGSFTFLTNYNTNKLRHYVAPFHDIFGVWILVCLVATYLTGLHFFYEPLGYWMDDTNNPVKYSDLGFISLPVFFACLIVFVVVVSPYFEWRLVGPI